MFVLFLPCSCTLMSVYPHSDITTGIERTAGPIGVKFGVITCGGWEMAFK